MRWVTRPAGEGSRGSLAQGVWVAAQVLAATYIACALALFLGSAWVVHEPHGPHLSRFGSRAPKGMQRASCRAHRRHCAAANTSRSSGTATSRSRAASSLLSCGATRRRSSAARSRAGSPLPPRRPWCRARPRSWRRRSGPTSFTERSAALPRMCAVPCSGEKQEAGRFCAEHAVGLKGSRRQLRPHLIALGTGHACGIAYWPMSLTGGGRRRCLPTRGQGERGRCGEGVHGRQGKGRARWERACAGRGRDPRARRGGLPSAGRPSQGHRLEQGEGGAWRMLCLIVPLSS